MIEIGGEILTKGSKPVEGEWQVGIEKPIDDQSGTQKQLELVLPLKNKAMATSGNYRNYYIRDGKKFAHEIDPKTGYPVDHNLLSATVIASDCMTADAWATAFMVMGFEKARKIAEANTSIEVALIYVDDDGDNQLYLSPLLAAANKEQP
jgi:thiamine biosynthesis lipoprotein